MRFLLFFLILNLTACEQIALFTTAEKKSNEEATPLSQQAEQVFWQTLHAGAYDQIPLAIKLETAAYLENPNNPTLAAHLGFLHIWLITERARYHNKNDPTIVEQIILARKYFADSVALNPNDARTQGFLGDSILVECKIFHDAREEVRGYFQLLDAIKMWPEFNYFAAGYPMSTLASTDKHFKEALHWQWQTLNLCAQSEIDKNNPDFAPFLKLETKQGKKRACWNSSIAPHNFEGFFLNMGDMLVKAGDIETGIKIYNNAKLSAAYQSWPYKNLLEQRIVNAQENSRYFNEENQPTPDRTILFNSGFGCAVCHQK